MVGAPQPQNVSQLRSFMGLINYYRRFLPNLASVRQPLNQLLQKNRKWCWTRQCEKAFREAKQLITSELALTHYDPELPVKLVCDALPYGLGAILSHVLSDGSERPVAFASRTLNSAGKNYSQIDKEALALVWGVKKFNTYLYGRSFTLVADHQPLLSIFSPQKGIPAATAARLQQYALFLCGHRYDIEYKQTSQHTNVDGLLRLPLAKSQEERVDAVESFHAAQLEALPLTSAVVKRETRRDPILSEVYKYTMTGWPATCSKEVAPYRQRKEEITAHQGCLLWGMRVIIPKKCQSQVLQQIHEGHLGTVKMKLLAHSHFWWPGVDEQLKKMTKNCSGCLETHHMPPPVAAHPWEWPTEPWQRIRVDYAQTPSYRGTGSHGERLSEGWEVGVRSSTGPDRTTEL